MDKNTKLAFFLIALVIILFPYFLPKKPPIVVKEQVQEEKVLEEVAEEQLPVIVTDIPVPELKIDSTVIDNFTQPEEKDITIETDLYKAIVSTKGGVIKSWKVKKYKNKIDTTKVIDLIYEDTKNLQTEIFLKNGNSLTDLFAEVNTDDILLDNSNDSEELILDFLDNKGHILFTQKYKFYNDEYSFDVAVDTSPIFQDIKEKGSIAINWKEGLSYTEVSDNGKNLNREDYYRETYVKVKGEDYLDYDDNDDPEKTVGMIEWGATRTKYFELFIYNKENHFDSFINHPSSTDKSELYTGMGFSLNLDKRSDQVKNFSVYLGPMDNSTLKSYDLEFESTLNWGWSIIKPFSLAIYYTLTFLHRYISNYGIVIILLSLIVNTLVLPFTMKSYKSQAKMKKIQPYIKDLKEKYKGDMQKQQQETMALYKKHGVNPFGSCLPTLIPMPILYGMFIVFGATIEFRGAEFMWWIKDLSLPEIMFTLPFSIPMYGANVGLLPILMAVTMFMQMKDTMGADPNQKMMKWFMPIFLLVLFNNFASGLILYYTIGNVFRMGQQKFIKKES
ncbi:MAG: membrane protein insertase YidC [Candidatus Delongbacteria bacterium]|nr:membrane protein insertase YidC [Candidatus Delongbacteria bacterium]